MTVPSSSLADRVRALHRRVIAAVGHPVPLRLAIGKEYEFPRKRDYAYAWEDPDAKPAHGIVLAPRFDKLHHAQQEAILRHELAHIYQFVTRRDPPHPEDDADMLAQWLWGDPIHYGEDNVQTLGPGTARPAELPR